TTARRARTSSRRPSGSSRHASRASAASFAERPHSADRPGPVSGWFDAADSSSVLWHGTPTRATRQPNTNEPLVAVALAVVLLQAVLPDGVVGLEGLAGGRLHLVRPGRLRLFNLLQDLGRLRLARHGQALGGGDGLLPVR